MWKNIQEAPSDREILLRYMTHNYTGDVYHCWWDEHEGDWVRWPHNYEPTHWMEIPENPFLLK